MLELQAIESFYGNIQALKGITLEVPAGAIVAILGANGAGKFSIYLLRTRIQRHTFKSPIRALATYVSAQAIRILRAAGMSSGGI